jgi:thioredoxin 1
MKEYNEADVEELLQGKYTGFIYLYTPLCGTCQTASKILTVLEELIKDLPFIKSNLNYAPNLALSYSMESVPCLLVIKEGTVLEKIYAFHSVPYLYEKLNGITSKKVQ